MADFTIDIQKEIAPLVEAVNENNRRIDAVLDKVSSDALTYSPAEVADKLGVSRRVVDISIRRGEIEARKFGRRVLVTRDSLDRFIKSLPTVG